MPPYQITVLLMLATGIEFGLLSLALLIEASHRKRRPLPARLAGRPAAERGRRAARLLGVPSRPQPEAEVTPPSRAAEELPLAAEPESQPEAAAPSAAPLPVETAVEAAPEPESVEAEAIPVALPTPPEEELAEEGLAVEEMPAAPRRVGFGLRKTREAFMARLRAALGGGAQLEQMYEELEEALIGADVGIEASGRIIKAVRDKLKNDARPDSIRDTLKAEIERILTAVERPMADAGDEPLVVMLAGVNGVGKTTTIAKLAARFKAERGEVIVAAADTFRAAAIEQLEVWCKRVGAEIIKQKQGSDPAAIAFDAVAAARARKIGTVLIDTAGRLQNKSNLMEELKKIARVVGRNLPGAPHEVWLVLDATTGQNALSQAQVFKDAVPLTGVVLAKLDSTAKGGVIVAVAERMKLPVRFVGVGESIEDLRPFDAHEFVEALFESEESTAQNASGSYAA
ncbi:MAG TPA: signal recognition particle-docking protein FtsY [Candidatus Binataceae bacterium]|nr:signal recognition particle-docking protein FtsY [Candidatus Binataceae bacterium]